MAYARSTQEVATISTAPAAGHRSVPHTADLRIEAWAPTREGCLAEAVRAVVEAAVDLRDAGPALRRRVLDLHGETDEDLLVAVLDEVVYWLDVAEEVPVAAELTPVPGGLRAILDMADARSLPGTGAAPKAVTLQGLEFRPRPEEGWRCAVTLDV